jgi:hypothetical protein
MSHTDKEGRGEGLQSWYLLALLTPWTYWMPLVYTGLRTAEFRWVKWGLIYGLPVFLHIEVNPAEYGFAAWFKYWEIAALIAAVTHSLGTRREYLELLAGDNGSGAPKAQDALPHEVPVERREHAAMAANNAALEAEEMRRPLDPEKTPYEGRIVEPASPSIAAPTAAARPSGSRIVDL